MLPSPVKILPSLLAAIALSACGTSLPITDLRHPDDPTFEAFVGKIAQHIRCEMHKAVATEYDPDDPKRKVLFGWAAKVALDIKALDKGNFNPSAAWIRDKAATFTFAVTGGFEADGTRQMTMTYYLPFNELLRNKKQVDLQGRQLDCSKLFSSPESQPIAGDLGIDQSLASAIMSWDGRDTLSERIKDGPFDTVTHHVNFVVIAGGGVTPTWKLVNVSANTTAPFLGATRTETDDLLITMGPTQLGTRKELPVSPLRAVSGPSALDESFQIERLRSVLSNISRQ